MPNPQDLGPNTQHLPPKTLLVTGGAGFIGSNFIRYILREHPNWTVINLDKLTYAGNLANLTDIEQQYGSSAVTHHSSLVTDHPSPVRRYYFVKGDITDRELVDSLFTGDYFTSQGVPPATHHLLPTAVINFAAESHVDRSILDASPFIETNIKGTQVLLEAIRTHWGSASASPHRLPTTHHSPVFLQISTDEVYGALGETGKFTEESPLQPNSPYAASKASADMLCRAYHNTYGLPIVVTRSSNNYGPYQFPEKLIPLMIFNALNDKPLPVYGNGMNTRDWIYVEDNCRAIDLIMQKGDPGAIYNIGASSEKKNIEVVKTILTEVGKPDSLIKFVRDRLAHDWRYALDASRTYALGWEPRYSFEKGLRKTIHWYREHESWIADVISGQYKEYYKAAYPELL